MASGCPSPHRSNESYDASYCTSQAYIRIQSYFLMVSCFGDTVYNLSSQDWVLRRLGRRCTDNLSISFCRARIVCSQIDQTTPPPLEHTPHRMCAPRSEFGLLGIVRTRTLSISFCRARIVCSQIDQATPPALEHTPHRMCAPRSEFGLLGIARTRTLSISFCRTCILCSQIDQATPPSPGCTPHRMCAPRSKFRSGDSSNTGHPPSSLRLCI
jgi:hypothetical protein